MMRDFRQFLLAIQTALKISIDTSTDEHLDMLFNKTTHTYYTTVNNSVCLS